MNEVAVYELPEIDKIKTGLEKIRQYQGVVKELLVPSLDYGVIPGTQKPTLLKPGAEKLAKIHGLADTYEIVHSTEDWNRGFFEYTVKCSLTHITTGIVVSEGLGSCNNMEGKYRYRTVWKKEDISPGTMQVKEKRTRKGTCYLIPNDEPYSDVNTILKMGKKRAMIDAVLSACRLSAIFTQDIEDIPEHAAPAETPTTATEKPQDAPKAPGKADAPAKKELGPRAKQLFKLICDQAVPNRGRGAMNAEEKGKVVAYLDSLTKGEHHSVFTMTEDDADWYIGKLQDMLAGNTEEPDEEPPAEVTEQTDF